jgi:ComF family protein
LPSPNAAVCGACLRDPPPFAAAVAVFAYSFPVDRLLQRLKYAGALALADWAAHALAARLERQLACGELTMPDMVVALPLAAQRQRVRGYNQAQEIARRVARLLRLRTVRALRRSKMGAPQAALPWSERAANVRHAYTCIADIGGRHVALVDDVMTTGATVREAARTLVRAGAASVTVWVIARTLPPRD